MYIVFVAFESIHWYKLHYTAFYRGCKIPSNAVYSLRNELVLSGAGTSEEVCRNVGLYGIVYPVRVNSLRPFGAPPSN